MCVTHSLLPPLSPFEELNVWVVTWNFFAQTHTRTHTHPCSIPLPFVADYISVFTFGEQHSSPTLENEFDDVLSCVRVCTYMFQWVFVRHTPNEWANSFESHGSIFKMQTYIHIFMCTREQQSNWSSLLENCLYLIAFGADFKPSRYIQYEQLQ